MRFWKRFAALVVPFAIVIATLHAEAAPLPTQPAIVNRGPHHRVWRGPSPPSPRSIPTAGATGEWIELATGLHYFDSKSGEWKETREEITIVDGQAAARHGPHRVSFAANLNSAGAIDFVSPDDKRFRSHPVGLVYTDAESGRSVLVAEIQDCAGTLRPPNIIVYENAFQGDCTGDVAYTYTRGGFEQDILLTTAPPPPSAWGLNPNSTRLEVFTEFDELPAGTHTEVVLKREPNRRRAARMREPDLVDQRLDFGVMKFVQGRAFPAWQTSPFAAASVLTGKSLEVIAGRTFLIEKVDYSAIRDALKGLPQTAAASPRATQGPTENRTRLAARLAVRPGREAGGWKVETPTHARKRSPALVLDYFVVNGSLTNWNFSCDTTYYISHPVELYGTTVLEGTVLKFARGASLNLRGNLECRTSAFQPAVLTGRDDNSLGAILPGSTGRLAGRYATQALACHDTGMPYDIHDIHIRQAESGVTAHENSRVQLAHAQITQGGVGIATAAQAGIACRNFLLANLEIAFQGPNGPAPVVAEHGTLHAIVRLADDPTRQLALTNCLLVAVSQQVPFAGSHTVNEPADTGIFAAGGAGAHYLVDGSRHRNAGTLLTHPILRSELRRLTTHAPILLVDPIVRDTVLAPRVLRDADLPDLGYHYAPLDYCANGLRLANGRLILTNDVGIGLVGGGANYGIGIESGAGLIINGRPDGMARLVRASAIQENSTAGTRAPEQFVQVLGPQAGEPGLQWRFFESVEPGGTAQHLSIGFRREDRSNLFRDCRFVGGSIFIADTGFTFFNCLLDRVRFQVEGSDDEPLRRLENNLFREGRVEIEIPGFARVDAHNNLFDRTRIRQRGFWQCSHNARVAGFDALQPTNATDRVLTTIQYRPGPLGHHYYPSLGGAGTLASLINAGSASATQLGLVDYTITTDQLTESASPVDIGFHFVAVDAKGRAIDADRDSVPNYVEDGNGNGDSDTGETSAHRYDSRAGHALPATLQIFTPLH